MDIVGQRRAADRSEIEADHSLCFYPQELGNFACALELALMALAIIKAQRVQFIAVLVCDRGRGG